MKQIKTNCSKHNHSYKHNSSEMEVVKIQEDTLRTRFGRIICTLDRLVMYNIIIKKFTYIPTRCEGNIHAMIRISKTNHKAATLYPKYHKGWGHYCMLYHRCTLQ